VEPYQLAYILGFASLQIFGATLVVVVIRSHMESLRTDLSRSEAVVDEPEQPAPSLGRITYRRVHELASAQAARLDELGIGTGERVAIVSHNAARMLAGFYGVSAWGRVYVPINFRLSPDEIRYLLRLAAELKAAKGSGTEQPRLVRRNIALIFEKDSTRTRTGFEVAAYDQGAHVTFLGPSGSHIGHKESMRDTARVLGRMYDAIEYRGFGQKIVEELAANAGVPVYNGLTDETHPTQTLADFMTMREFTHKHLSDMTLAFLGDGRDNVALSTAIGAAKVGIDMRIASPRQLWPDDAFVSHFNDVAKASGAKLTVTGSATNLQLQWSTHSALVNLMSSPFFPQ